MSESEQEDQVILIKNHLMDSLKEYFEKYKLMSVKVPSLVDAIFNFTISSLVPVVASSFEPPEVAAEYICDKFKKEFVELVQKWSSEQMVAMDKIH